MCVFDRKKCVVFDRKKCVVFDRKKCVVFDRAYGSVFLVSRLPLTWEQFSSTVSCDGGGILLIK